jgi:hypothetical protein
VTIDGQEKHLKKSEQKAKRNPRGRQLTVDKNAARASGGGDNPAGHWSSDFLLVRAARILLTNAIHKYQI